MTDAALRNRLAWIASRPPQEWERQLAREFPSDPALRAQALMWLHAARELEHDEGRPPSLGEEGDARYELTVRIDSGATASVWQALDRRLGRAVAVKVFHADDESEDVEQVLAEARAASDVISDHVVRVLDVQHGDRRPYIVMELVSEWDETRGELVAGATAAATRPRDVDEVARWVMQVARGVHDAHMRNVFHRDLKPRNVLVTPISRRARVADFGLAVCASTSDSVTPALTLLRRGPDGPVTVRGTPEYMAPEQARGLPLTLDPRVAADRAVLVAVDVWGLGAIAYGLLAGHSPWRPRPEENLTTWEVAVSDERPPRLRQTRSGARIPRALRMILDKAMATDPRARYESAAAVANELQAYLARRPTTLDRSPLHRVTLWCRRSPQLAVAAVAALCLAVLAVGAHLTLTEMRHERRLLDEELEAGRHEQARLAANVARVRRELAVSATKLASERAALERLESSIAQQRAEYQTVIEAKEQSLAESNTATRRLLQRLEAERAELAEAKSATTAAEQLVQRLRGDLERATRERDRMRKERDVARTERDRADRERDAALAERDAAERHRETEPVVEVPEPLAASPR